MRSTSRAPAGAPQIGFPSEGHHRLGLAAGQSAFGRRARPIAGGTAILAAALLATPSGGASAFAIYSPGAAVAGSAANDPVVAVDPTGIDCRASGASGLPLLPGRDEFDACVGAGWIASSMSLLLDPARSDYALSPFNREITALLHQMAPRTAENYAGANENVEAAIIDAFQVGLPDRQSAMAQLDAPDLPGGPSDGAAVPYVGDTSASAPAADPSPPVSLNGRLPQPFRMMFAVIGAAMRVAFHTRQFVQENQWMFFCALLAVLPVGVTQLRRRWRRYR